MNDGWMGTVMRTTCAGAVASIGSFSNNTLNPIRSFTDTQRRVS